MVHVVLTYLPDTGQGNVICIWKSTLKQMYNFGYLFNESPYWDINFMQKSNMFTFQK